MPSDERNAYLEKHRLYPPQITVPAPGDLQLVVVIPCHNEPSVTKTLDSLRHCARPPCCVEIIVIVNATRKDGQEIHQCNVRSVREVRQWALAHGSEQFTVHALHFDDLPLRRSGVGVARKLGMDEAVHRFHMIHNPHGVIVSLDADCTCASNYLTAIYDYFRCYRQATGAAIYFEHSLDQVPDGHRTAIASYELYLRYYIQAQRAISYPHAFHTVGSSMAVRTRIYQQQGGMNSRRAGEDFYFLHKVIALGHFGDICNTVVMPSARVSTRAPFGTGQEMRRLLTGHGGFHPVCSPDVFAELDRLFAILDSLYCEAEFDGEYKGLSRTMTDFLAQQCFDTVLHELRANSASPDSFRKRFYRWFTALKLRQFVRHATQRDYPPWPLERAAAELLRRIRPPISNPLPEDDVLSLLSYYRRLDRYGTALDGTAPGADRMARQQRMKLV